MKRHRVQGLAAAIVAAGLVASALVREAPAAQKELPAITGVWKLNVEASTNPNGPSSARSAGDLAGRSGGRDTGAGGGGAASGGGGGDEGGGRPASGGAAGGSLGAEELRRFNAIKTLFFQAPPMMGIEATATDFKMLIDPKAKFGYAHKTDNKKQSLVTPAGPADFKVKWEGARLRRDIETRDTLHVVEDYALSADGKQLIVTVKADSRMVRNVLTMDIRRVYDRQ
jgi:hypothetical protein